MLLSTLLFALLKIKMLFLTNPMKISMVSGLGINPILSDTWANRNISIFVVTKILVFYLFMFVFGEIFLGYFRWSAFLCPLSTSIDSLCTLQTLEIDFWVVHFMHWCVLWSVVDSFLKKKSPLFFLSLSLSLLFLGAFLFPTIFWSSPAVLELCRQWVVMQIHWLFSIFHPLKWV